MPDGAREQQPNGKRLPGPTASDGSARLNERVYDLLASAIADGSLPSGAPISEGAVIRLLNVTRAPVRQAFGRLRENGLLRRDSATGYVVVAGGTGPWNEADLGNVLVRRAGLEPLRKAPAWTRAYDAIERVVIHQAAFGRARINELELSRHLGIGRAPTRDVLMRLELLGMLERDAGSHWSVVALDAERVRNLNEVRERLEPTALIAGFAHLRQERLLLVCDRLRMALARYPDVTPDTMNQLENDLHFDCLNGCSNGELLGALRRTHCVLTLSKHVLGTAMPMPVEDPFLREHLVVLERLAAADIKGAATALTAHIASATPLVIERVAAFRRMHAPPELSFFRA